MNRWWGKVLGAADRNGRLPRPVKLEKPPPPVEIRLDPISLHPIPGPCCPNPLECRRPGCWTTLQGEPLELRDADD